MKVLQVNVVYKKGSTGKIAYDLHTALIDAGVESVMCYGRGAKTNDNNTYKTCSELYAKFNNLFSRFTGIMYGGCFFSTNKLISVLKKENPDIVHLQCINGYFVNIYRLITWLKKNKIKTVLTLHAEFMHTANCGHAFECDGFKNGCGSCPRFHEETKSIFFDRTAASFKKMRKAFDGFGDNLVVTSVSPWLMERAKLSPILADKKHTVIMNGLDTDVFYPYGGDEIRQKLDLNNKKFVLFVTPAFSTHKNHLKGGWYLIKLAFAMPDVVFGLIGAEGEYKDLPKNIINIGRVENQDELAKYYSAADLTVLLSKRETFSMVLAESLCCGTPVAGFKAGGPETIQIPDYCSFVDYGDIDALITEIKRLLLVEKTSDISKFASLKYNKQNMTNSFFNVYKALCVPKILQVNVVYNKGSTGKIAHDIHTKLLEKGYESVVCYGRGIRIRQDGIIKVCTELYAKFNNLLSRFTGIMYGGCFFSTNKLISVIKKEKPDVVHLHCINGYFVNIYKLITWLKENNIKTVLTLHAEFMHTANCGYALDCENWKTGCGNCPRRFKETKSFFFDNTARSFSKMKAAFDGFNDDLIVTSVSPWLMNRAKASPIFADKQHITILNGLNDAIFYPHGQDEIRQKHNLKDKKFVLFVTPNFKPKKDSIKGSNRLIELANAMPDVVFGLIGAKNINYNLPSNIINLGWINNQDLLAKYYSAADVSLLLSKKETFSMVTAESLCCGTPVVGFKAGGPESIDFGGYTDFVEYGDLEALQTALRKAFTVERNFTEEAQAKNKKDTMIDNYIKLYKII